MICFPPFLIWGDVADVDGGKVGLAGHRAEAGELGADEFDEIVVVWMFVVERFQNFRRVFARVLGFLVAKREMPCSSSLLRDMRFP